MGVPVLSCVHLLMINIINFVKHAGQERYYLFTDYLQNQCYRTQVTYYELRFSSQVVFDSSFFIVDY